MAGRDLEDRVAVDVEGPAVLEFDVERPGDRVAKVVDLARRGAGQWSEIRRPPPARLPSGQADRQLIERHDVDVDLGELPRLIGLIEALCLESRHGRRPHIRLRVDSNGARRPLCFRTVS